MTALLTQTPQPPSAFAAVPPALDRVVMRCLEREPERRSPALLSSPPSSIGSPAGSPAGAGRARRHTTPHPCLQIESVDVRSTTRR